MPSLEFRKIAHTFVAAAVALLVEQRVLPRPAPFRHLRMAEDYFGPPLMELSEFRALEAAINQCHSLFADDAPLAERRFANGYIFSFLEACLAANRGIAEPVDEDSDQFIMITESLSDSVSCDDHSIAVCRVVGDATSQSGFDLAGVSVIPVAAEPGTHRRHITELVRSAIPRGDRVFDARGPGNTPLNSVALIIKGSGRDAYETSFSLSRKLDKFVLVERLMHGGTLAPAFEVSGSTSLVNDTSPTMRVYNGPTGGPLGSRLATRLTTFAPNSEAAHLGIARMLDSARSLRPGLIVNSFEMALMKYEVSFHLGHWWEEIVDLTTSLEAALSGKAKTDVLLRIRTRAASLLSTENDAPEAIFKDLGEIYDIRSRLVHGSDLTEKELRRSILKISTVRADAPFGIAIALAVDRLRDIVRRALLVRLCLATSIDGSESRWDINESNDAEVDWSLTDNKTRLAWSSHIGDALESISATRARERTTPAKSWV